MIVLRRNGERKGRVVSLTLGENIFSMAGENAGRVVREVKNRQDENLSRYLFLIVSTIGDELENS